MYDVIIIGAGPAGLTAAIYVARAGKSVAIVAEIIGGAASTAHRIDNYPGMPQINGFQLTQNMYEHALSFGIDFISEKVVHLELIKPIKEVVLSKSTITAKKIIIATGSKFRKLGLPNENSLLGRGISYCATCDGNFFRNKDVVVVGGGDTAICDALFLSSIAKHTTLIHRRDEFRAAKSIVNAFKKAQITFISDSVVSKLVGDDFLTSIEITNVKTGLKSQVTTNGVFVAIGSLPNSELVKDYVNLDNNGYIITDAHMRTNVEGVFAVGDVRNTLFRQIITACADGAISAESAVNFN
ncbi:MAG: thioredoxin-disulfide reductase [Christensenellaceae bacterium]|jgi:thioredoxin reductase (NADPH)|nr:thioredoxin-disulfide reductase [Christensenellaceae bacterium]